MIFGRMPGPKKDSQPQKLPSTFKVPMDRACLSNPSGFGCMATKPTVPDRDRTESPGKVRWFIP